MEPVINVSDERLSISFGYFPGFCPIALKMDYISNLPFSSAGWRLASDCS